MRFNGRNGSPADPGDLDIGSQRGCVAPARRCCADAFSCPGRAKRDPGPGATRRSGRVALGPGSSLADAHSARPGHEACKSRLAKRTVGRSRIHDVKQRSVVRSRGALLRPGWSLSIRIRPEEGWAERRQAHYFCCRVCETRLVRTQRGAARPMTRDARLSALHRGDFRPGAALPSPALPPDPYSELLAARSSAWRAVSRTSRARGYEPRPQDATPRSAFRIVSRRRPSMSEDENLCTINSLRSQQISSYCS